MLKGAFMLLVANGSVFTRNAQTPFIPNGAVAIDGDTIVEVGPECELKSKYPDAEYVEAGARIGTAAQAWGADIVLHLNPPSDAEIAALKKRVRV